MSVNAPLQNYFVIFAAMRTGSNLLQTVVKQLPGVFCYGELFNNQFLNALGQKEFMGFTLEQRDAEPLKFLEAVLKAKPNEISGFRIFQNHNDAIVGNLITDPNCKKIILRRDPIDSYISLKIVNQTKQWLVGSNDPNQRRTAKVTFDPVEFISYERDLNVFYDNVINGARISGQEVFEIDYSEVMNIDVINRLGAWIGSPRKINALEEELVKQNPSSLEEKVKNYDELKRFLSLSFDERNAFAKARAKRPRQPVAKKARRKYPGLIACRNFPILYANIPKSGCTSIKSFMHYFDTGEFPAEPTFIHKMVDDGTVLISGVRDTEFEETIRNIRFSFTFVRHPLRRVYSCFLEKIFFIHRFSFERVRRALNADYGLKLPNRAMVDEFAAGSTDTTNYDLEAHRENFKAFLRFIDANLAGEARNIRTDAHWGVQARMIERHRKKVHIDFVGRLESFHEDFSFVVRKSGFTGEIDVERRFNEGPEFHMDLEDILDDEIIALGETIYAADYKTFGYTNDGVA